MPQPNRRGIHDNTAAAVAYITFVPAIVFLALPRYSKNPFVRFHAWQSIFLTIVAIVLIVAQGIIVPFSLIFSESLFVAVTWLVWLAWILLWVICGIEAVNGKRFKLPIIGAIAEKKAVA